jgi:uncharacterized membrane protein
MSAQGLSDRPAGLTLVLASFRGSKTAADARSALRRDVQAKGGEVLDDVVLRVSAKRRVDVYDPRREALGAASAAFTWGLFGLLTGGGLQGLILWAVIGAICGGLGAYYLEHGLSKAELAGIGRGLPADSSVLAAFVERADPSQLSVAAAANDQPTSISLAVIDAHLSARIVAGDAEASGRGDALMTMLLFRYQGRATARSVLAKAKPALSKHKDSIQVGLVADVDAGGRVGVSSPSTGVAYMVESDILGWGGFGLVFGAIAGLLGGGGILGALEHGVITMIAWGIFGAFAGALYGLLAGRAVSGRRLRRVGSLLPSDSSAILAWAQPGASDQALASLSVPDSDRVVLDFVGVGGGVVLRTAP